MFGRIHRAQLPGHPDRACLPHWCCRTVLPDGVILLMLHENSLALVVLHHMATQACNFICGT